MRIGACAGILFPLPLHMLKFVCDIRYQDLVERMRFDSMLSLLTIRRMEELYWAAKGCLRWYHYKFRTEGIELG